MSTSALLTHWPFSGVMFPPDYPLTKEGYDLQFGTTVVGHFYFTELLMPALFAGAQTSPDHHARVVTTASMAAYMQTLEYDTFRDGPARRALGTVKLYNQSKHVSPLLPSIYLPISPFVCRVPALCAAWERAADGLFSFSLTWDTLLGAWLVCM